MRACAPDDVRAVLGRSSWRKSSIHNCSCATRSGRHAGSTQPLACVHAHLATNRPRSAYAPNSASLWWSSRTCTSTTRSCNEWWFEHRRWGGRLIKRSSDGDQGNGPGYAGISTRRVARRARSRAGGLWGTVAEGFEPRAGAARAPWPRAWASPCRGGERTSGIRRSRALWRPKSPEVRARTGRSSTQIVSPRAGARCVPVLLVTLAARARKCSSMGLLPLPRATRAVLMRALCLDSGLEWPESSGSMRVVSGPAGYGVSEARALSKLPANVILTRSACCAGAERLGAPSLRNSATGQSEVRKLLACAHAHRATRLPGCLQGPTAQPLAARRGACSPRELPKSK